MTATEIPTPDPRTLDDASREFAEAVADHYAIKRHIGSGGMGVVYLARDRRLDRLVAIKTLPPSLAKDAAVRERFLRETRTAGAMAHPNIVPIHGADDVGGHVYFVMSFVDGESLAAHIRAHGRLQPRAVAAHLRDVAAALTHAHQRGIIHRDIKAENILLDRASGRAMVTDFGIARLAEATPLTVTGQLLGTVYYVSPEQVSGVPVDARSDLYSLGVVGFLALTGRFPFEADIASAVLVAHVTKAAPPVASLHRGIPASLGAIIDRCLMKDPAHRYASAEELGAALESAIADLDRPGGPSEPRPSVVSNTEAHAVWKRAAELQALTGVQPRPEAIPRPRDPGKYVSRGSGMDLGTVREAAEEAGIGADYLDHALIEHGLKTGALATPRGIAPTASALAVTTTPAARSTALTEKDSFWAGGPVEVVSDVDVEGEMPGRDLERLLLVLRDETGRVGNTSAMTRELSWWTGGLGARLDVSVIPADGRTAIRVVRSIRRRVVATVVLSYATLGFPSGALAFVLVYGPFGDGAEPLAAIASIAAGLLVPFFTGRRVVRWFRTRAAKRISRLAERLGLKVRQSVTQTMHDTPR